jgi:hypothetical protein
MRNITENKEEPRTAVKTLSGRQQKHMRNHLMRYFNNKGDSTVHMLDVLKPDTEVKSVTAVLPEEVVTNKSKFDDFKKSLAKENGLDAGIYKLEVAKNNRYHLHAIGWDVGTNNATT